MSRPAGIQAIRTFQAGARIPVKALPEAASLTGAELEYFTQCGIDTVCDAQGHTAYDLAKQATESLLSEAELEPGSVDILIYIRSRIPGAFISSEATRLQHELKMEKALVFSLSDLGCADSSMALKLASDLLAANPGARNVVIAYGHRQFAPARYRYPVSIQGDGGVAVWVMRGGSLRIREVAIETNGYYWDLFSMPYLDRPFEDYVEHCSDVRKYGFELALESRNRYQSLFASTIEKHQWQWPHISQVMMQNISGRAFDYYENAFGFSISPVCRVNLARNGHLGCADIFYNLQSAIENGMIQPGEKLLVMNNSPVAAWSVILLES